MGLGRVGPTASLLICLAGLIVLVCAEPGFSRGKPVKDIGTENAVVDLYNKALEFKRAGRLVHARILLEKAATADPTSLSGGVHAVLCNVYRELGNSNQAIREGLLSLKYDATDEDTYYLVALCLKDARRYDESIQYLEHYAGMVSGKRKDDVLEMVRQLQVEKEKLGQFSPNAPDYLDQLRSEASCNRWARNVIPIKVYIEPDSNARGFDPAYPGLAHKAFITWYHASNRKLSFEFVNDPSTANIQVVWTDKELRTGEDAVKERTKAGLTTSRCTEDGEVKEALIQIRTVSPFSKQAESEDRIKETCLHEAGHALGLNGHSTNNADIMYYGTNSKQLPALTKRDRATIARLYADFPAYPMVGVDTSFPYPSPDTDIPRLTNTHNGSGTGLTSGNGEGDTANAGLLDGSGTTSNGAAGFGAGGFGSAGGTGPSDSANGGASAALPAPVQLMLVPPSKKGAATGKSAPPAKGGSSTPSPITGAPSASPSPTNSDVANNLMPPVRPGQMMLQNNTIPNLMGAQMGAQSGSPVGVQFGSPVSPQMGLQMGAPIQGVPQQNYGQQNYYTAPTYPNQGAMPNWNQQGPGSYAYGTPGVPTSDGNVYNPYATAAPQAGAPAVAPQNPLQFAQQLFQQFTGGGGNSGQPQMTQQPLGQSGQQPMQMLNQVMQMFQPKQK